MMYLQPGFISQVQPKKVCFSVSLSGDDVEVVYLFRLFEYDFNFTI